MAAKSILFNNQIRVPANVFDLASFRRWATSDDFPEEGRISFLDGQLEIDTSPEEISSHVDPKGELIATIWTLVRSHNLGRVYVDGVRLTNDGANISNEPDLMFCSWETLESGRVTIAESSPGSSRCMEVVGSPDLVIEIVSKSSVRKDTRVLKKRYFVAGIEEYWLVDARKAEIDFQILSLGPAEFEPVSVDRRGFRTSKVLNQKFKLIRERDRLDYWQYTLLHNDA